MRVVLDTKRCIGAGACVLAAKELFDFSDEGVVELLREPTDADWDKVKAAAAACPTGTISIAIADD